MSEESKIIRCPWSEADPLDRAYHDAEWGRPLHDEQRLFALLNLEGMQAGLSWSLILKKREDILTAFDGFSPSIVAQYGEEKAESLLGNPAIIRNRLKIKAATRNAQAYLAMIASTGSLNDFLWSYVGGESIVNHWEDMSQVPAKTELSDRISRDMKKLGFTFVGSTIVYAYMQSIGMVDDHLVTCFRHTGNR